MNEAEEIEHLRRLKYLTRLARVRLERAQRFKERQDRRLLEFMSQIENRKIIELNAMKPKPNPDYVSKHHRWVARVAGQAMVGLLVLVLAGCQSSPVTPRVSGACEPTLAANPLPPLPGEVASFKFQEASAPAAPVRQKFLRWDGNADEYLVQTGAARGNWTNSFRVATNAIPFKSGVHYSVSAIGPAGEHIGGALWPSNRIAELRLRDNRGGDVPLLRYTNNPPGAFRFWRVTNNPTAYIANETVGWQ